MRFASQKGNKPTKNPKTDERQFREEIAFGGPFVMNTQKEIREAFRDLQRGVFGPPAV